ncbi:MAG: hypothetical protein HYZ49_03980 [Chloroflexi bacterium]|nr:hypothetical protein [Chloroflexota bacterium]
MSFLSPEIFRSIFAYALFLFGLLFISAGFWKLMAYGLSNHARTLAAQSARIGQKGLADDIARLMQAAVQLNESVSRLLMTSAGVGFLLTLIGCGLLTASYFVAFVLQ